MNQQEGGLPCLSEVMHQALNAKNERVLLEVIEKYSFEDIQKCFEQEPTLFHRICAQGFHTLATFFLEAAHIDPTIKHEGRTALQWACLNGHQDIVQLLLPTSIMEQRVWQDNSEFYSASLAGNIEIIRCLFQQHSYLLKDDEVRTSLLYAACIGGNIDVVKFWLIPGMDVNKPVELVSALRNCELMVPLYAACEGMIFLS
ncbi:serine/threonine-protein phosphatase 6 regulatory ankyrin repeat subunit B-like [Pomacea canaliculata]|uniref:serine/threonine-protein phosphatase 6 regulatory ankyrin repeat subunit B-like n=1 Tax=Pomacea canaliculata TaxID=400727 RepID=UPI000D734CB9|nr:serine/threonine-protein phosphatase 6 regulatory ankyrin repeat subunit B-like [Pomacea canaliculata]